MFGRFGPWELILVLVIALVIFGPKKLPELGRGLGKGLKEFKGATKELRSTVEEVDKDIKSEAQSAPEDDNVTSDSGDIKPDEEPEPNKAE